MPDPPKPASNQPSHVDPWAMLRKTTNARVGLERHGDAPALRHVLELQAAHGAARDAVAAALDAEALMGALLPFPAITVASRAPDRATFLRRPDLGRRLADDATDRLPVGDWEIIFVLVDGLSARAVQHGGPPLLHACLTRLAQRRVAPVVIVQQGRVAIGDEIGARLGARLAIVLIGERPGLSVADSLGVYLTIAPRPGRRDHERNCISNIHPDGLTLGRAADTLLWLADEALQRGLTGVALKEQAARLADRAEPVPGIGDKGRAGD